MLFFESCNNCGREAEVAVIQRVIARAVVWSRSLRCKHCGNALEEDGDTLALVYRDKILKEEGDWSLEISPSLRLRAMRVAREMRDMSLAEAKVFVDNPRGTRAETECFRQLLEAQGIEILTDKLSRIV